jgi:hypothetical protein
MSMTLAEARAASRQDTMSIHEFAQELKRGVGGSVVSEAADPLGAALQQIGQDPERLQSQLLTRMLIALTHDTGLFRRSEVFALDRDGRALAVALVAAHAAMPVETWKRVVDASGIVPAPAHSGQA